MDTVPGLCRRRSRVGAAERESHYKATGERTEQAAPKPTVVPGLYRNGKKVLRASDYSDPIGTVHGVPNLVQSKDIGPFQAAEQRESVRELLKPLTDQERFVVLSCVVYGREQKDVGIELGLGQSRVSQIRTQALKSLRGRFPARLPETMSD